MSDRPDPLGPLRRGPKSVVLHGHRGARGLFPENTMPSYRHVIDTGLKGIEIDVLVTREHIPVLTHFPRLLADTTRNAQGEWLTSDSARVSEMTLAELQSFDVGAIRPGTAYHARFPEQARLSGLRIPTLAELCGYLADHPGVWLNIEIKCFAGAPDETAPPEALARAVWDVVAPSGLAPRTFASSFDWRVLHALRALAPDLPRFYLSYLDRPKPAMTPNIYADSPWMDGCALSDHGDSLPRAVAALGGAGWCPHISDITPADLKIAHDLGLVVNIWTVNEPEEIRHCAEMGVDGIITDFPGRAQNVLAEIGFSWR